MSEDLLRPSDGRPIWLPPGADVPPEKREIKAYTADDGRQGKALVETGLFETGKKFWFVCPICGNRASNDQRLEPACTGPSWRNEHPMEPMQLVED